MDDATARSAAAAFGIGKASLKLVSAKRHKTVWKVKAGNERFALVRLSARDRAEALAAASRHLAGRGVPVLPPRPTPGGDLVVRQGDCFLLFPWLTGERPSYRTPGVTEQIVTLLARFHEGSRGFAASGAPVIDYLLEWPTLYPQYAARLAELRQAAATAGDAFGKTLLGHYSWLEARTAWVQKRFELTAFGALVEAARKDPLLRHGDYSNRNLLRMPDGGLKVLDLDLVGLALPMWDLSWVLTRVSRDVGWDANRFRALLDAYGQVRRVTPAEEELVLVDQVFPHQIKSLASLHYRGQRCSRSQLEHLLSVDRAKLADLGVGPQP